MKKIALLISLAFGFAGCNQTSSTATSNTDINAALRTSNETTVISSHSPENNIAPTATANPSSAKNPASSGGSPMAKAIDTSQMTVAIEKADQAFKAKPNDAKAKNDLAEAYFVRAFALTEAAQYRSALGDFRKGLKLNPNNADAKGMHDQIISIFQSIGREPPKEGDEPKPLPFEKQTASADDSRITFEKGATSAIAKGNLKNYDDSKTFKIEVRAGQTLDIQQIRDDKSLHIVTLGITDPHGGDASDRDASCNSHKTVAPTIAGDYIVNVVECRKADAWSGDFQLKVSVR